MGAFAVLSFLNKVLFNEDGTICGAQVLEQVAVQAIWGPSRCAASCTSCCSSRMGPFVVRKFLNKLLFKQNGARRGAQFLEQAAVQAIWEPSRCAVS